MRTFWLVLAGIAMVLPARAQAPIRLSQVVQWQVVPELRVVELEKPVVFILEVRNNGPIPVELRFSSGKRYDVLVYRQGEWSERWQWSRGKMFPLAVTTLRLRAGEVRRFRVEWNQRDNDGRQVPPGDYRVEAILPLLVPPGRHEEFRVSAQFRIREPRRGNPVRLRDLLDHPNRWVGREVLLEGRNAGGSPDPNCPMCSLGRPITRNNWTLWVLEDGTGCLFVAEALGAAKTPKELVFVEGTVRRSATGGIYIEARQVFPTSPR